MSINLLYRRPAYVNGRNPTPSVMSTTSSELADSIRSSKPPPRPHGVPEMLSFDRIIANGTCPVSSGFNSIEGQWLTLLPTALYSTRFYGLLDIR
jgi:hypothetical protein